jgi:hypothetical protein
MKIMIAVNNDDVSQAIFDFYKDEYNETLEIKNIYYFKALLEELKNNSYDRIVIHEELEPFATNNYAVIDDNLFNTIDKISDESHGTEIIFLASERRKRDDKLVKKLFNMGIYNILIGEDRTIEEVAKLIKSPRQKKDAKSYIDYDLEEESYKIEQDVDEAELNRILIAYENAGMDETKIISIFDHLCDLYTEVQVKVICTFLPDYVKKVLSEKNEKFKAIFLATYKEELARQDLSSFEDEDLEDLKGNDGSNMLATVPNEHVRDHNPQTIEREIIREVYETPQDYRKVVCFVGSHKVGTSFMINAVAAYLSKKGIQTAIVDFTKNRDSYFVYAMNNEAMREVAANSLSSLGKGKDNPIVVNKINVYTGIPGQYEKETEDYMKIIDAVKEKNTVVLLDCDFYSPADLFKICQNIYVVQDMDILNLQPITTFLRDIKYNGVNLEKVKVIINKYVKCGLPIKRIIEGISYYSNPQMTVYDELFVKNIPYYVIPFDEHNYRKYAEGLYYCKINYSDFTEEFANAIEEVVFSIYPTGKVRSQSAGGLMQLFNTIKNMILNKPNDSIDDGESRM